MIWVSARQLRTLVLACWAMVATAGAGWAAGMDSTNAAFSRLEEIRAAAALGQAAAQFKMGDYFYARSDFTNAVNWYELAADQDHRGAQLSLATCYLLGRGAPKDIELAGYWSARARGELESSKPRVAIALQPRAAERPPEEPPEEKAPRRLGRELEHGVPEVEPVQLKLQRYGEADLTLRSRP